MLEQTVASIRFGLIGPELALLIAASVILVFGIIRVVERIVPIIALSGLVAAMMLAFAQWGHQDSGFAGMVTCDTFGVSFKLIFLFSSMLALFIAYRYLTAKGIQRPEYYALLLFSTMGMMIMANTNDLVVIFLGLEVMSVPLYVMAGYSKRSLVSNEAGLKYFIMGAFASAFLLMGIAFVYGASGTTNLREIAANYNAIVAAQPTFLLVGAGLTLVGFAFKVAAVPFHSWVPDVYQGAPTPVTAFFSVGPKAAGFAALLRIFMYGFDQVEMMTEAFWLLAVLTMTVGNILALRQDNVKRMLAYSSIAHAGYVLVALAVGGEDAVAASIVYLVGYMLFNFGAFTVITILETRVGCTSEFSELAGLAKHAPYLSVVLAIFMFALAGFPATVGFVGKFYLFSAAVRDGQVWLAIIGVLNSFVSVYYYLRVVKTAYFDEAEGRYAPITYSPAAVLVLAVCAVGTLGFGIFPEQLLQWSRMAIFAFI